MTLSSLLYLLLLLVFTTSVKALSDADRKLILDCHNGYRTALARGQVRNKDGSLLPQASNLVQFQYDTGLEAVAQRWANRCTMQHSGGQYGENLHMTSSDQVTDAFELQSACNGWWNEIGTIGIGSNLVFTPDTGIGHMTQMGWASTARLGCAIARCPQSFWKTYLVCNYDPPGNFVDQPFYKPGPTCSACATDYPGSSCNRATSTCDLNSDQSSEGANPTTRSSTTTTTTTSTTTTTVPTTTTSTTTVPTTTTTTTTTPSTPTTTTTGTTTTTTSTKDTTETTVECTDEHEKTTTAMLEEEITTSTTPEESTTCDEEESTTILDNEATTTTTTKDTTEATECTDEHEGSTTAMLDEEVSTTTPEESTICDEESTTILDNETTTTSSTTGPTVATECIDEHGESTTAMYDENATTGTSDEATTTCDKESATMLDNETTPTTNTTNTEENIKTTACDESDITTPNDDANETSTKMEHTTRGRRDKYL